MAVKTSRRERERQRHRREILAAARELFSQQGYERTTMAQIAARAEFAVGTLYKFFEDKRALYRALILETVQEFEQALDAALKKPGTEVEKLERYLTVKMEMFLKHVPMARLYFAQTAGARFQPVAGLDAEGRAIYQRMLTRLEGIFRRGIRKGLFVRLDPSLLALGLEGVSNVFLEALIERHQPTSATELAEAARRMFFEPVLRNGFPGGVHDENTPPARLRRSPPGPKSRS